MDKQVEFASGIIPKASIQNEKNVTWQDILAEGNAIWRDVQMIWKSDNLYGICSRNDKLSKNVEDRLHEIHDAFKKKHPQIFTSYPTVMMHMFEDQQYHPKAFEKYLRKVSQNPWRDDKECLESYVDYALFLYKELNPKYNMTDVTMFAESYRGRLNKQHKQFRDEYEKCLKDYETTEEKELQELRAEFKEFLETNCKDIDLTPEMDQKFMQILSSNVSGGGVSRENIQKIATRLNSLTPKGTTDAVSDAANDTVNDTVNELPTSSPSVENTTE